MDGASFLGKMPQCVGGVCPVETMAQGLGAAGGEVEKTPLVYGLITSWRRF